MFYVFLFCCTQFLPKTECLCMKRGERGVGGGTRCSPHGCSGPFNCHLSVCLCLSVSPSLCQFNSSSVPRNFIGTRRDTCLRRRSKCQLKYDANNDVEMTVRNIRTVCKQSCGHIETLKLSVYIAEAKVSNEIS